MIFSFSPPFEPPSVRVKTTSTAFYIASITCTSLPAAVLLLFLCRRVHHVTCSMIGQCDKHGSAVEGTRGESAELCGSAQQSTPPRPLACAPVARMRL